MTHAYKLTTIDNSSINNSVEIPAAIFSQLTIQGWKLLWSPPEDCTTILGPVVAKLNIRGVSDAVKDFNQIKKTARNTFDLYKMNELYGAEWYEVKIYVVRDYMSSENISAYQVLIFETPPKGKVQYHTLSMYYPLFCSVITT